MSLTSPPASSFSGSTRFGCRLPVAGLFYLLFVAGIVLLVVQPAASNGGWTAALWMGAVLGLVAYGTYDITNLSTLRGWSLTIAAVDLAWGVVVTAVASIAGYLALVVLGPR